MKVWVVFMDEGWDGCSYPMAVFDSKEKAMAAYPAEKHNLGQHKIQYEEFEIQ